MQPWERRRPYSKVFEGFRREYQRPPRTGGPSPAKLAAGVSSVAVGLRASSTIVGLHFAAVAGGGVGFAGSAPIAGKVQLEGFWWVCNTTPAAGELHELQLAIDSEVPGNQVAVDAGEQLFARASTVAGEGSTIYGFVYGSGWFMPLTTVVAMNGRRFIGRIKNLSAAAASAFYVGLVMHQVVGGALSGDPAFLSGEEVEMR